MDREQVVAFRAARHGLDARRSATLAEAAACPISEFVRGSAVVALAARLDGFTRSAYEQAIDSGELAIAPSLRAAIHVLAPQDLAACGRDLVADDDDELLEQLGHALERSLPAAGIAARDALDEVAAATSAALADGGALTKDELHEELRKRVRDELLPWCRGCGSHHVSPMLWRYAGVKVGVRLDSRRRYVLGAPGTSTEPAQVARRFLRFYGPATATELGAWAGLARAHARRLWSELEDELVEARVSGGRAWLLAVDEPALASPASVRGVRLLPARDPFLQQYDRATLVPDAELRRRLFRPVAGPGALLHEGRIAGLWRARSRGSRAQLEVELLEHVDRASLEEEAARVAAARGARAADLQLV